MYAGKNGRSIRKNGRGWPKKDTSPGRSGRKNGKSWSSGRKIAGEAATARLAQHELSVLNIARHFLKEQEREEKAALRDRQGSIRKAGAAPALQAPGWASAVPRLGNLWRFRKRIAPGVEVRKREFPKVGKLTSPYAAYREMVKKRFPEKMDESRLDAAIVLYMRCAGYTPQEVANELFQTHPRPPQRPEP